MRDSSYKPEVTWNTRCDLDLGKLYRKTIFNFAKHREPEAYRLIVERKGAIPPPEI